MVQTSLPHVASPQFLPALGSPGGRIDGPPCATPPTGLPRRPPAPSAPRCRLRIAGVRAARRRARLDNDDDGEEEGGEYGHNPEIAELESYSSDNRNVALLVRAGVDGDEEEVLIFKGFSSLLSSATFWDPSKSILPARATIKSVDVVKGPFDPSNVDYLERNLTLEEFKNRHLTPKKA